ncbi:sigma-70 family RNA polymerase sigma factor [Pedosphaera parvula]|uniref:Putative RNA polymerase, sigma 70 family subunit n=1 Tax=Pedosphaera parvula (strain Ellin514) TaxID=320771 RepID=B9XHE2_PEDPL|nr:sigma-70 family RNA polymerase sigma factor [Pedosphaera parvula]EEF60777.1 putative RNA polymerase, sigma 70 family subunit [Pedosphaera parvula Ellin514]
MKTTDNSKLLSEFVQQASEPAFRDLVARHVNLVYSTALRLVAGDTHLAQDITQSVFTDLSRKAKTLAVDIPLAGWLHRHTCFTASKTVRSEQRRQRREKVAAEMNALHNHPDADFSQLTPVLDDAINQLGESDRTAILLRFFEQHDFRSLGAVLGTNEDAARMRVTRALDKLHSFLKRRGVSLSVTALATALTAECLTAAPAGFALKIATAAIANGKSGGITFTFLKMFTATKLKFGIVCAIVGVLVALLLVQRATEAGLREQNLSLKQQSDQLAQVKAENDRLSKLAAQSANPSLSEAQFRELVRLRGEVRRLRQQRKDFENAAVNQTQTLSTPNREPSKSSVVQIFLVEDQPSPDSQRLTSNVTDSDGKPFQQMVYTQKIPLMDQTYISSASVTTNTYHGEPQIELVFTAEGRELFGSITKTNLDHRLAVVMDGQLYSAPVVRAAITSGKVPIPGPSTMEEAERIASVINSARTNR